MRADSAARALASCAWRMSRRGALIWGAVFGVLVMSSVLGYESSYPDLAQRLHLASTLEGNAGLEALFGQASDLASTEGFVAWRISGPVAPIAAIWGLLLATRLLRGEEDAGRWELVLAGTLDPRRATWATLAALAAALAVVWALATAFTVVFGVATHGFPVAESLWFTLALVAPAAVFMAVGALVSQLAASRRQAAAIGFAVFGVALLMRMAADSAVGVGWLRWLTPFGWIEEMRPLTGAQPLALVPVAALMAALLLISVQLASRRDLGAGFIAPHDRAAPDFGLLGSTTAQALRAGRGSLLGWCAGVGLTAFAFGLIAKSVAAAVKGSSAMEVTHDYGADVTTAAGYLGLTFLFLIVVICLFVAARLSATREEESLGRTEELFALPVSRRGWLGGHLCLALGGVILLSLTAALGGWLGSLAGGAGVPADELLLAGLNSFPISVLFLGFGALAFALVPRETGMLAFGLVAMTFLLAMVGETLQAPSWILDLSPFHHLGVMPGGSIEVRAALVMLAIGAIAGLSALVAFDRRDAAGA